MSDVERAALIQCAQALAFSYAGTRRPTARKPEKRALWDAMHAAYAALATTDTRDLIAPPPLITECPGCGGPIDRAEIDVSFGAVRMTRPGRWRCRSAECPFGGRVATDRE